MKAALTLVVFILVFHAHAGETPAGVDCMKQLKADGMKMEDSYQSCTLSERARKCILVRQRSLARKLKGKKLSDRSAASINACKGLK